MTGMKKREKADLLVEDAVALVDVRDVALVLVVSLSRELALLVDTRRRLINYGMRIVNGMTYSLLIFSMTRSIASSLGLLSAYSKLFASR